MSAAPALELFLARLYTEPDVLEQFIRNPEQAIAGAGLDEHDAQALRHVDRTGLVMAARSYANKRGARNGRHGQEGRKGQEGRQDGKANP